MVLVFFLFELHILLLDSDMALLETLAWLLVTLRVSGSDIVALGGAGGWGQEVLMRN